MKPASEGTLNILLIKAREEQNLTQQAVANHIGCDLNNVSRWERGIVFPSPYFRRKLCELYGKNEEELGFFKQNRVKKPPREKPSRTPIISTVPSADREMLLTPILGREREIVTILNFLQEDKKRLVTITGTGGVGKTRLAREVEARLIKDSQYKTIYVSLASLANNTQVLPLIGKHLGLENSITSERVIAALKGIPARHLLVVLDNFEHVRTDENIDVLTDLLNPLTGCETLQLLVTSRIALHARYEKPFPLRPLQVPNLKDIEDVND